MQLQAYIQRSAAFRWPIFAVLVLVPLLGGCSGPAPNASDLLEQVIIGLLLGSIYALIALGYTLVYGVIKLINFAHCDIYMLGAFAGYYCLRFSIRYLHFEYGTSLIICFALSVLVSALLCAVFAVLMERLAYRPLRKSSRIAALITAVGLSYLIENAGILAFGASPKSYEPKTLPVYQLQLTESAGFDGARSYEIFEHAQKDFHGSELDEALYARVRLISRHGESEWSPVLEIPQKAAGGFEEEPADGAEVQPGRPHSIGFTRSTKPDKHGRPQQSVTINWAAGRSADVQLERVFAGPGGEQIALHLPVLQRDGQPVRVSLLSLVIIATTLITLFLLNLLVNRSMFGISMRALSYDLNAAKLMGVDTDLVISQTFAIGGAAAAIAGNLVGLYNQSIDPLMGILPGLKAFVAAVVGGIGSIPGAAVGGLIMGLSEALLKGNIDPKYSNLADALAFAILILVLLFKPSGIFGRSLKEKV